MKKYLIFLSIGFELTALIVGSYFLGSYLDQKYHSDGLIFVGLSIASLISWLLRVVFLLKRISAGEDKQNEDPS